MKHQLNHGLALSGDGKTVYVSSAESVFAFAYDSQAVRVDLSSNVTLVTNMSNSDHTTRTLLVSKKQPGTLLVSRGSSSNEDDDARDINSGHSQIRSFNITRIGPGDSPYNFLDGNLIGWGLRNSVGVAEHPSNGGIWSVENSVDQLQRQGQDIHQNNPGEELNYHGVLGSVLGSSDNQGGNYGYPDCYTLWSTAGFPDLGDLQVGDQFADDDAPSNVTDASCNTDYIPPRIAFQAHSAPLDIKFSPNASEAFVTFHGSCKSSFGLSITIYTDAHSIKGTEMRLLDTASSLLPLTPMASPPLHRIAPTLLPTSSPMQMLQIVQINAFAL